MRPVTVCHPVWELASGGLERQLVQVVNRLPRDKFEHILLIRGCGEGLGIHGDLAGSNVRLVRQPSRGRDRLWWRSLASVLRQYSADVLHVRGLSMLLDGVLAARLCGDVRVAFSFHGFEHGARRLGRLRRRLYREAALRCDRRWAVSRCAAEAIAEELRLPVSEFEVLANGVDERRFAPTQDRLAVRRRLGLPSDGRVVLSVGNLKPVKGHDVLLEAIRSLGGAADGLCFVLAGKDYLDGDLQRWAGEHLGGRDVRFVGEQQEVLPWYQAADVFVLPSRWEGMSNALLEAMSCGLPAIATAVGGNGEVIQHERTGLLVRPDDAAELCSAIRLLANDEGRRAALGEAGQQDVHRRFSADGAVGAYAERYEELGRRDELARGGFEESQGGLHPADARELLGSAER